MGCDNFDAESDLYWYRKLAAHPNPNFDRIALEFTALMAERLGIRKPTLHWYEPADRWEASNEFDRCIQEADGSYNFNIREDCPLDLPCAYFRWPQDEPERVGHGGYTHRGDTRIMIAAERANEQVLSTIAHECRHLFQDARNGADWRCENLDEAESDAVQFEKVSTTTEAIQSALP